MAIPNFYQTTPPTKAIESGIIIVEKDKHYTHIQDTPSSIWIINHYLGKRPAISIVDTAGTEVYGIVEHNDLNRCTLRFSCLFSGTALCN